MKNGYGLRASVVSACLMGLVSSCSQSDTPVRENASTANKTPLPSTQFDSKLPAAATELATTISPVLPAKEAVYTDLHAPLYEGQHILQQVLPLLDAEPYVFSLQSTQGLDGTQVQQLVHTTRSLNRRDLSDESLVLFFRVPQAQTEQTENTYTWVYCDPQSLQLIPCDGSAKYTPIKCNTAGDTTIVSVMRTFIDATRSEHILQCDIRLNNTGNITPFRTTFVTAGHSPVYISSLESIVFCRSAHNGKRQLWTLPLDKMAAPQVLLPTHNNGSKHITRDMHSPQLLADGSLLFSASFTTNSDSHHYEPYRYDFSNGQWYPCPEELLHQHAFNGLTLTHRRNTQDAFSIARFPQQWDLRSVLGLVAAHNTSVNKYRALLAATLSNDQQLALHASQHNTQTLSQTLTHTVRYGLHDLGPTSTEPNTSLQSIRANIAADAVREELNRQLADASTLYMQARSLSDQLTIDAEMLDIAEKQINYWAQRQEAGHALRARVLQADTVVERIKAQQATHQKHYTLAVGQLKNICALPAYVQINFPSIQYRLQDDQNINPTRFEHMAMSNHPRIRAARAALAQAFSGAHTNYAEPIDQYIASTMQAPNNPSIDAHVHAIQEALLLSQQQEAEDIKLILGQSIASYRNACNRLRAVEKRIAWALEQVRLSRLYEQYPLAETSYREQVSTLLDERFSYYETLTESLDEHATLSAHYVQIWEHMGLMNTINEQLARLDSKQLDKHRLSVWVIEDRDLIADNKRIDTFIAHAQRWNIKRAYVYLDNNASLLDSADGAGRLTVFLNRCAAENIEIWGLVGEASWLLDDTSSHLRTTAARIAAYNETFGALEPLLAGVVCALAPHAQPGWARNPMTRTLLSKQYVTALRELRAALPQTTLFAECPLSWFNQQDDRHILEQIESVVDGVCLQYNNLEPDQLSLQTRGFLESWSKQVEIGVPVERTRQQAFPMRTVARLANTLAETLLGDQRYHGLSCHDYTDLAEQSKAHQQNGVVSADPFENTTPYELYTEPNDRMTGKRINRRGGAVHEAQLP